MGIGAAIAGFISSAVGGLSATSVAIIGAAIEAAVSIGVSALSQSLRGQPKGAERPGRQTNVRSATMAHQVVLGQIRKGGLLGYVNGTGEKNKYLHTIVVLAGHECEAIGDLYIGGQPVPIDASGNAISPSDPDDTDYRDYAFLYKRLGTSTQAAVPELVADTAGLRGEWTAAHQLKGRAYVYGKYRESPARYGGIPPITAVVTGVNAIYDPRSATTAWTENPALQVAWMLETYLRIPRARIHEATLIEAANICDEAVPLKAGGTQKRYTSNGYIDLEGDPADWLEPIINAMAGALVEHDGLYYIHAGAWKAPVTTLTDAHFIGGGEIVLRTAQSNIDRSNGIKGVYVSPESYDSPTEFPTVKDAAMIAEDGGAENILDIDSALEFCNSHQQAQRVAKIRLQRQRMDESFSVDVALQIGLDVKPWDNITVNSDVLGISGTYKVTGHVLHTDETGPLAYVTLTLQAHTASVYDWTAATDEQDLSEAVLNIPRNDGEPSVTVHADGDAIPAPTAGVDNDRGNVGDVAIDLKNSKILRKLGNFS